jgi:hypothetical protein
VGEGGEAYSAQAGCPAVITFEEGVRGGGEEVVLDKQAMIAHLPSAFNSPPTFLLQCFLCLFLAGCEALSR